MRILFLQRVPFSHRNDVLSEDQINDPVNGCGLIISNLPRFETPTSYGIYSGVGQSAMSFAEYSEVAQGAIVVRGVANPHKP